MNRPHWRRGFTAAPQAQTAPMPFDGCATCRDGRLPCITPTACGLVEDELHPPRPPRPLFADNALASKAIGCVLALAFAVWIWVALWH